MQRWVGGAHGQRVLDLYADGRWFTSGDVWRAFVLLGLSANSGRNAVPVLYRSGMLDRRRHPEWNEWKPRKAGFNPTPYQALRGLGAHEVYAPHWQYRVRAGARPAGRLKVGRKVRPRRPADVAFLARLARLKRGSWDGLAAELGVNRTTLQRWRSKGTPPLPEHMRRIRRLELQRKESPPS